MFALYHMRDETSLFHQGYWTTREGAEAARHERPLYVRPVQLFVDHYEEVSGCVVRNPPHKEKRMYDVSARVRLNGARQCMGWYATLTAARKKRDKYRGNVAYDDWVIEESWMGEVLWDENVASDTESESLF
jgi:hypothetical protein